MLSGRIVEVIGNMRYGEICNVAIVANETVMTPNVVRLARFVWNTGMNVFNDVNAVSELLEKAYHLLPKIDIDWQSVFQVIDRW